MVEKKLDKRIVVICNKIRDLRIAKGYSSYENFSFDHDLPRMQYWRAETGANLTLKTLLKIIDAHNITLEEFFKDLAMK